MTDSPVKMMLDVAFGRQQPNSAGRADAAALHAVAEAAVVWWTEHRPSGWSLEQHLTDPLVNCEGSHERRLAEAVSKWVLLKG
jgi:hypothetical protein